MTAPPTRSRGRWRAPWRRSAGPWGTKHEHHDGPPGARPAPPGPPPAGAGGQWYGCPCDGRARPGRAAGRARLRPRPGDPRPPGRSLAGGGSAGAEAERRPAGRAGHVRQHPGGLPRPRAAGRRLMAASNELPHPAGGPLPRPPPPDPPPTRADASAGAAEPQHAADDADASLAATEQDEATRLALAYRAGDPAAL